ncbi:serine protease [Mesorhizobium sp. CA7]|nr:serine protease [Mesorhizobium sp. CA7]
MHPLLAPLALLFLFVGQVAFAASQQCKSNEALTEFGRWFNPSVTVKPGEIKPVSHPANYVTKALRLQISVAGQLDPSARVIVRDEAYHFLASFAASDLPAEAVAVRDLWTGNLPASDVTLEFRSPASNATVSVTTAVALPPTTTGERVFSLQGAIANWKFAYKSPHTSLTQARLVGDEVGMMVGGNPDNQHSWCCSAVIVGDNIALTNWHCGGGVDEQHWSSRTCAATIFDFGWDDGAVRRQYSCAKVLLADEGLDFALIALRPVLGGGGVNGASVPASVFSGTIDANEPVFLVHHALCEEKRVSSQCKVVEKQRTGWRATNGDPSEFSHNCDSETGASGSPVFDLKGRVIGLHHLGFDTGPNCTPDHVNKAIRMDRIKAFIGHSDPVLLQALHWD